MKANLKVLLLLATAATLLVGYALWGPDPKSDKAPKKIDLSCLAEPQKPSADTVAVPCPAIAKKQAPQKFEGPDTTPQNILFFGDSMLEGLTRRFIDYAEENGHRLKTVIWYSSSTEVWAKTDTLQHFIRKFQPTYIVICLGGNELFVRDLDNRRKYIARILDKIDDTPFVWISPPNWKEDTGINAAIAEAVGRDRYFDSTHLKLERGADHAHPTFPAAAKWMDLIAGWLQSDSVRHPIIMNRPKRDVAPRDVVMLAPYKAI